MEKDVLLDMILKLGMFMQRHLMENIVLGILGKNGCSDADIRDIFIHDKNKKPIFTRQGKKAMLEKARIVNGGLKRWVNN